MAKVVRSSPSLQPGAWVVTNNQKDKSKPSDRGRKSVKNGKVYLDDGQEFELELHNPLQECVLCDIKLNGQSISKSGLVLRPGQRFYLDCFVDDKKRFIFKTYEVENTEESNNAISKNGMLEIYFYKEQAVSINNWRDRFDRIIVEKYYPVWYYPVYYPYRTYPYGYPTVIYGSGTTTIGNTLNTAGNSMTYTSNSLNDTSINGLSGGGTLTSTNVSYSANSSPVGSYTDGSEVSNIFNAQSLNSNIETGRVEKGSSSSQEFGEIDMEFQSSYITHTIIQLLPNSRKPVETDEIKKSFCSECGSKTKENFKFCPSCGNKLS